MVALLTNTGTVHKDWEPFVEAADDFINDFKPAGKPYTCSSKHFASPETLKFSSDKNDTTFGDPSTIVDGDYGGIRMGLVDESVTGTIDIDKVLQIFKVEPSPAVLKRIVELLAQFGGLEVDTARPGNGYWVLPNIEIDEETKKVKSTNLDVATRIAYKVSEGGSKKASEIIKLLNETFKMKIPDSFANFKADDFAIIFTDIITLNTLGGPQIDSTVTVRIFKLQAFVLYVSQTGKETIVALKQEFITPPQIGENESQTVAEGQVNALERVIEAPSPEQAVPADGFKNVRLWYAEVDPQTGAWVVALILILPISNAEDGSGQVPIYLKYYKEKKTFSGGLLRGDLPEESNILLPRYREYHSLPEDILEANDKTPWVDLEAAFGFKAPKGLPTKLTKANISYKQKDATPAELRLEVELGTGTGATDETADPPSPFNWEKASFSFEKIGSKPDDKTKWTIHSEFALREAVPTPMADGGFIEDGKMAVTLTKEGTSLNLLGEAENINFAMLGKFFDPELSETIVDILGKIKIAKLEVDYTYNRDGKASDFLFTGIINIGSLKLDLFYQYASAFPNAEESPKKSEIRRKALLKRRRSVRGPLPPPAVEVSSLKETAWEFNAFLSASGPEETLGSIIMSITGTDPLPDFLSGIKVPTKGVDVESDGKPLISLKVTTMEKVNPADTKELPKVIFIFEVALDIVEFSFIQIATQTAAGVQRLAPVRILRLSIGPLPFIEDIPIVKELPQPYQLLTYCYVGGPKAITKLEIDKINEKYIPDSKIFYKAETQRQIIGLRLGHHFVMVNDDECIIDHVFGTGQKHRQAPLAVRNGPAPVVQKTPIPPRSPPPAPVVEPVLPDDKNAPAKGALQKKSKLLTINGVSVQYKKKTLWLVINATLTMGPVELSLIGFGIGLKLDREGFQITDFLNTFNLDKDMVFQINGVAMNFDQPPVLIAGVFIHEKTETIDSYRGGIAVGFKPYEFVAIGEYAEVTENPGTATEEKYKSIFLYAKLDGPLIDLAIAIIKGVRLGFGYNSFVRSPSVHELADFPFINDSGINGAGNNPMKILEGMRGGPNPWVAPKQDSFWFAVGFSVSAFNLLTATAVALLGFSDDGVVINIFADVTCQMPPEVPSPDMCIVYVELLMNAELNFIHDYFFVQAALAPTSFLLVPQCHLYGGFAMGTWFGRSDYAGDWVFSVGGYHRQFDVPAHYPRPDRLGIRFNIGDNMSIRGEGYFAITPKAVMGGAMIYVQLSVGPVKAHLTAGFDALLQFNPLHYIIDVYVEVGVSCRVHLLFVSFDISIEIGADLHIEGPEFGGVAHVDFWFFGFDVYFGEQASGPPPLKLKDFYDIVAKAGPPEESSPDKQDPVEEDLIVQIKLSLEEGAAPAPVKDAPEGSPPPNAGSGSKWRVKGGDFKFRVSSVFAITSATLETKESVEMEIVDPSKEKALEQTIKATQPVVPVSSIPMQVHPGNINSSLSIRIIKEDASRTDLEDMYPSGWQPEFVVKPVPTALWGDPANPPNALDSKNGCVDQQMAVRITAPLPLLSPSKIKPVNATEIARQRAGTNNLPPTESQDGLTAAPLVEMDPPQAWKAVETTWINSVRGNLDVAKSLVDGCMKSLGWDKPAPEVVTKNLGVEKKPWVLEPKLPERLIKGNDVKVEGVEDGLDNFYLALPRMVVV